MTTCGTCTTRCCSGSGLQQQCTRICELYLTDDLSFKRDFKTVGDSLPQVLGFVLGHTGLKAPLAERFRSVLSIFRNGQDIAQELIATVASAVPKLPACCAFRKAWRPASTASTNISMARAGRRAGWRGDPALFAHCPAGPGGRCVSHRWRAAGRAGRGARACRRLVRPGLVKVFDAVADD